MFEKYANKFNVVEKEFITKLEFGLYYMFFMERNEHNLFVNMFLSTLTCLVVITFAPWAIGVINMGLTREPALLEYKTVEKSYE